MSDEAAQGELFKIAKLNGDFRKNYGPLLGAFLYLRSISAARGRSWIWTSLLSAALGWLSQYSLSWFKAWH